MRRARTNRPTRGCGSAAAPAGEGALLLCAAVLGASVSSAAAPAEMRFGGRIVVVAGSKERVFSIDAPNGDASTGPRWELRQEVILRRVSPLWTRLDGSSISEDPAFRRREFNESGELVGRPVNVTVRFELWVEAPRSIDGIKALVELQELSVTAHRYKSFLGYVRAVDSDPLDLGRLPSQVVSFRAGTSSSQAVSELSREFDWNLPAGRGDVVRLAGRAYGLRGRCRVSFAGYGTTSNATADALADVPSPSGPLPACPRYELAALQQRRKAKAGPDLGPTAGIGSDAVSSRTTR